MSFFYKSLKHTYGEGVSPTSAPVASTAVRLLLPTFNCMHVILRAEPFWDRKCRDCLCDLVLRLVAFKGKKELLWIQLPPRWAMAYVDMMRKYLQPTERRIFYSKISRYYNYRNAKSPEESIKTIRHWIIRVDNKGFAHISKEVNSMDDLIYFLWTKSNQ